MSPRRGKTHTLIALYHLVSEVGSLSDLPAVEESKVHAGLSPPRACVAALCFDKLDAERGMEGGCGGCDIPGVFWPSSWPDRRGSA